MAARSTWPPWVYSTSQRTMERWQSTAGFNKKPQGLKVEELETCLKLVAWQTLGNLVIGNPKLLLLAYGFELKVLQYYKNHCHPTLWSDPTLGLSPSMIWEAPGSMYALAKERSVSAWLIPVYDCFRSFSRTNVGNKYLHLNLHPYFHGSMSEWDLFRIHVKFPRRKHLPQSTILQILLPRPAHHGSLGISSVPMTQWARLVNHILAKWSYFTNLGPRFHCNKGTFPINWPNDIQTITIYQNILPTKETTPSYTELLKVTKLLQVEHIRICFGIPQHQKKCAGLSQTRFWQQFQKKRRETIGPINKFQILSLFETVILIISRCHSCVFCTKPMDNINRNHVDTNEKQWKTATPKALLLQKAHSLCMIHDWWVRLVVEKHPVETTRGKKTQYLSNMDD